MVHGSSSSVYSRVSTVMTESLDEKVHLGENTILTLAVGAAGRCLSTRKIGASSFCRTDLSWSLTMHLQRWVKYATCPHELLVYV